MKPIGIITFFVALFFIYNATIFGQNNNFYKQKVEECLSRNDCEKAEIMYESYKELTGKPDRNLEARIKACRESKKVTPPEIEEKEAISLLPEIEEKEAIFLPPTVEEKEVISLPPEVKEKEIIYPVRPKMSDEPEMVFIQGGTFTMGCTDKHDNDCYRDERPAHRVTVSSFYIGKYPVTQAQWAAIMGSYPSYNADCDDCPVERISWNDVQEFILKLNNQTGKNYRLPTEAEWEYAAHGGNQSKGYKYSGSDSIKDVAWCYENYMTDTYGSRGTTHPVGTKKPNESDVYDMSGNIFEWCSDWYGRYDNRSPIDSGGPSTGLFRVLRGGSWFSIARNARITNRHFARPGSLDYYNGFRLARDF